MPEYFEERNDDPSCVGLDEYILPLKKSTIYIGVEISLCAEFRASQDLVLLRQRIGIFHIWRWQKKQISFEFDLHLSADYSPKYWINPIFKNLKFSQLSLVNLNYLQVVLISSLNVEVKFRDNTDWEVTHAALALMDWLVEVQTQIVLHPFLNACWKTTEWAVKQGKLL